MEKSIKRADGKQLSYIELGTGPGLLIVHGAFRMAKHYLKLAELLASDYTVYIIDRRGRGLSEYNGQYTVEQANSDIDLMIKRFNIEYIFGHSFGAVNTIAYLTDYKPISLKAVVYEPPILEYMNRDWFSEFESCLDVEDYAKAFVLLLKGMEMGLTNVPNWLMIGFLKLALLKKEVKVSFKLMETIPADFAAIEIYEQTNGYDTDAEIVILSGSKTPDYLKSSAVTFNKWLANSSHIVIDGLGHNGPDEENPNLVAKYILDNIK